MGSSHGETRITRLACGEGPEYTQFARRSHEIWRELEAETGKSLLVQNGFLAISGEGRRAANHENPDFLGTTVEAAERAGIVHELLRDAEIRKRHPAFNIVDGDRAYFEPEAGYVRPEECIAAQLQQASALGAQIRTNEIVTGFTTSGNASASAISPDGTTLTLVVGEAVVNETGPGSTRVTSAVSISAPDTIKRSTGNWSTDGSTAIRLRSASVT